MEQSATLASWNDRSAKASILEFVRLVTTPGGSFVPPPERIATFDNDGTLWCEKPMYVQADFVFRRFKEMVREDPPRAKRAALQGRSSRVTASGSVDIYAHVPELVKGVTEAFAGITTSRPSMRPSETFFASARHPTLGLPYTAGGLPADARADRAARKPHDFQVYICSAGGRDFVRAVCEAGLRLAARPCDRLRDHGRVPRRRPVSNGGRRAAHRRWTWEARPHLDPNRAQAPTRRRQRRWGHTRCWRPPASRSSCTTTTGSASSPTTRGAEKALAAAKAAAGPWSA